MRGTAPSALPYRGGPRFIPAHAGNRRKRSSTQAMLTVHPRACGEQYGHPGFTVLPAGSSPRMRGTDRARVFRETPARFIPAHAGNSSRAALRRSREPGSSPRMRGTDPGVVQDALSFRFIPAHAGNRLRPISMMVVRSVHPRACGEQVARRLAPPHPIGSSPRMRGTAAATRSARDRERFIPAHAGNSSGVNISSHHCAVHPRACGEQAAVASLTNGRAGSSPRMRGTVELDLVGGVGPRFIPAHAGNSCLGPAKQLAQAVHPRACGEQSRKFEAC